MVRVMKKTDLAPVVHEMDKSVTELVTRGANGAPYSTYQKRNLGAEAGG
jgi:hypothetical protein